LWKCGCSGSGGDAIKTAKGYYWTEPHKGTVQEGIYAARFAVTIRKGHPKT
jgi:hypothetical protein